MISRGLPWLVLLAASLWTWSNREVSRFALANGPGLLGFGEFGVLEERRLGLAGRALAASERPEEAAKAFEASLAIDPRGEYRRDLALARLALGDDRAARREFETHLETFPRDALAMLTLALLLEGQGAAPDDVRAWLLRARDALEAERRDLETPARAFPPEAARKHERALAELEQIRRSVDRELERLGAP